jgi:hypothetical protein
MAREFSWRNFLVALMCLIIRLALYCWKDWMGEARHDVLDG